MTEQTPEPSARSLDPDGYWAKLTPPPLPPTPAPPTPPVVGAAPTQPPPKPRPEYKPLNNSGTILYLVIGLIAIVCIPLTVGLSLLLGPFAMSGARRAKAEISVSPQSGDYGIATAGYVIGILATVLLILYGIVILLGYFSGGFLLLVPVLWN